MSPQHNQTLPECQVKFEAVDKGFERLEAKIDLLHVRISNGIADRMHAFDVDLALLKQERARSSRIVATVQTAVVSAVVGLAGLFISQTISWNYKQAVKDRQEMEQQLKKILSEVKDIQ